MADKETGYSSYGDDSIVTSLTLWQMSLAVAVGLSLGRPVASLVG